MSSYYNNITQFIESQFPEFMLENGELINAERAALVDFLEAYFEWLEANRDDHYLRNRKMFDMRDIDTTMEEFIDEFKAKYMNGFPIVSATDDRFAVKHIIDLYRAKGSSAGIKLLIRLLFNEEADIYLPGEDILRLDHSQWIEPRYVEVISNNISNTLIGKKIIGSKSRAEAKVAGVTTKRVNNKLIDVLYLADLRGQFKYGDLIGYENSTVDTALEVIGSLSGVEIIESTASGNEIGDIYDVESSSGKFAKARVANTFSTFGVVDFKFNSGGFGYTDDDNTVVYISDNIYSGNNSTQEFVRYEKVHQNLELVTVSNNDQFEIGDEVEGYYSNTSVATGTVLGVGNNDVTVQVESGSFLKFVEIDLNPNTSFDLSDTLEQEHEVILELANTSGTFSNGEIIYFRQDSGILNYSNTVAQGKLVSDAANTIYLVDVFGTFPVDGLIEGRDSGASGVVVSSNTVTDAALGSIEEQVDDNTYKVVVLEGTFETGKKIRGGYSKVITNTTNVTDVSADEIRIANTAITDTVLGSANVYFSGTLVGQNASSIGIENDANTSPFVFVEGVSKITGGANTELVVNLVSAGTGANFAVGSPITNQEVISINADNLRDRNVAGVKYMDINLDGTNSGVGYVDSVIVSNGGAGYTNASAVTFVGGGYSDQNPLIEAKGTIVTDVSGVIQSITIDMPGEGYYTSPTIEVADGAGAILAPVMVHGYGFPKDPYASSNTPLEDILSYEELTVGSIAFLKSRADGQNYNAPPFVAIVNQKIKEYEKYDVNIELNLLSGSFVEGEIVLQAGTGAKGLVNTFDDGILKMFRVTFDAEFDVDGGNLTGQTTGSVGTIISINEDTSGSYMGENADVTASVTSGAGVASEFVIIESGFGFIPGETLTLTKEEKTVTGTALLRGTGIQQGYWRTFSSHIDSEKKLQDDYYYQEYSYDVRAGINLNDYKEVINRLLHVAGTLSFGTTVKKTQLDATKQVSSSVAQS